MSDTAHRPVAGGLRLAARAGFPAALAVLGSVLLERIPPPGGAVLGLTTRISGLGPALGWYALMAAPGAVLLGPVIAVLGAHARGAKPARSGAAAGRAWSLWLAGLLYNLGVVCGLVLLIVPGFVLSVVWVLYAPAVILGGRGPLAALAASVARARTDWAELGKRIAGPFIFYGAAYALPLAPWVFAAESYALAHGLQTQGLQRFLAAQGPPAWFSWGLMPVVFAAARLYLLAGVTSAWIALER